jgi:phosphoribosylformylglycinamidine synthase
VRIGRLVELETGDADRLPELCEKLLANPLIEEFEIELLDTGTAGVAGGPAAP